MRAAHGIRPVLFILWLWAGLLAPGLAKASESAEAFAARSDDPPLEALTPYYRTVLDGLIAPTPGATPATPLQDYYALDVQGFNASRGTADFLEAKRAYYGALAFDPKTQRH